MNVWRRGSLRENPYYRTAFRVTRVPPEIVQHRTVVKMIGQTRRLIGGDPRAHMIQGRPVTDAAVNVAESILLDAKGRIIEELLEHATERLPLDRARRAAEEVAAAFQVTDADTQAATNLTALYTWAERLLQEFLDEAPGAHPSFGALELELVPPYGRPGEE